MTIMADPFTAGDWTPVGLCHTGGTGKVVLVCEHASAVIPPEFGDLGLAPTARLAHVAWDIGALAVARKLAPLLDAPLVFGGVSRLLFDCNRALAAADAIPATSEIHTIPGNRDLDDAARQARHDLIHVPFHATVDRLVTTQSARTGGRLAIVTIHSFTPVYHGVPRPLELGFIHGADPHLSERLVEVESARGTYRTALNEPYAAPDGVAYTLDRHADRRELPATMVEIRNDLIDDPAKAAAMARHLAASLRPVLLEAGLA